MNANETHRCLLLCILAISSNVAEIHFVARNGEYFFSVRIELYESADGVLRSVTSFFFKDFLLGFTKYVLPSYET